MYLNLHNLVKIELIKEPKEVRQLFTRELGIFEVDLSNDKDDIDIRINFVDRIKMKDNARFIGFAAAYDSESFYITNLTKTISVVLRSFGPKYEINCEVGIRPLELYSLLSHFFIHHVLLRKRAAFIHSSAVFWGDKCLLFPGFMDTGKTTALLSFLKEGGQFISNDLTIIKQDGTILSYPEALLLNDYHIKQIPSLAKSKRRLILDPDYVLANTLKIVLITSSRLLQTIPIHSIKEAGFRGYSFAKRIGEAPLSMPFHVLFPQGKIKNISKLDVIFFMEKCTCNEIKINEVSSEFVAERMVPSLLRGIPLNVMELYEDFRFAFPEKGRELIKEREEQYKDIIEKAFRGKQAYHIKLPMHYDSDQLVRQLSKYL